MTLRAWSIVVPLPVWTVNAQRQMHHHALAKLVREYRGTTCMLARSCKIPHLDRIALEFTPSGPQIRQDTAAAAPAAKALLDGLVDAGVVDDDGPRFVPRITFLAPMKGAHGLHALILDIADLPPDYGSHQAALAIGTPA